MPSYRGRQEARLLLELLDVVLAKVELWRGIVLVQGEDVGCGLELRDCYEADLKSCVRSGMRDRMSW